MCLCHAVFSFCVQVQNWQQFIKHSLKSTVDQPPCHQPFLSCHLLCSPAGWPAVALYSQTPSLLPDLFPLLFVMFSPALHPLLSVKFFNDSIIKCTWPYLTWLHLHVGQQPEGGQCAQTVDHRGPRASSQETLLLRTLSGWHAVRTYHQQAPHRHRFLGRALWIQQPASRPQPTPSSIQGDRQEETQGD